MVSLAAYWNHGKQATLRWCSHPRFWRNIVVPAQRSRRAIRAIEAALHPILALVTQSATIVDAPDLADAVSADPDDDKFLACACAVASRTPVIVSGDKHLLHVSGWGGIEVLSPRQVLDRYIAE